MRAILLSACGCERSFEWDERSSEWNVALRRAARFSGDSPDDLSAAVLTARRFRWEGYHNGCALFREVEDIAARKPDNAPVPFTTGEWAEAVARFSSEVRGDIHEADLDFLRRHDGATIIQHKNGVLIGAFYAAPSWSHSEDAVALFTALRRLLGKE
jgi:hypothetical protein